MKPEDYNPKAREAFAKSLIDIGVAIFKGIMILIIISPISFLFKLASEGKEDLSILNNISDPLFNSFIVLMIIGFGLGYYFRREGLRHLHELENNIK
jgi:ABC-type long-subunit fatty acid transport system fused permease/ATPase subunit